jgi:hypothetical protein
MENLSFDRLPDGLQEVERNTPETGEIALSIPPAPQAALAATTCAQSVLIDQSSWPLHRATMFQ